MNFSIFIIRIASGILGILTKTVKGVERMHEQFPVPPEEETLLVQSGAATEMTGLIPSGYPDKAERDSYQDVLPYFPPFRNPRPAI